MTTLFVSLLSYVLKAFPFFYNKVQARESSYFFRSLEYSVCFIIGTIIFNVAFNDSSLKDLVSNFETKEIIILTTVVAAYITCKITSDILKSLVFSMAFFIFTIWGLG